MIVIQSKLQQCTTSRLLPFGAKALKRLYLYYPGDLLLVSNLTTITNYAQNSKNVAYNSEFLCGNDIDSNPYAVLGIKNCEHNRKIIKKSGKALRATLHLDKNPNNQHAHPSFVIASSAMDILSNSASKRMCDKHISYRCFEKRRLRGAEANVLKNFYRRRAQLQRAKFYNSPVAPFRRMKNVSRNSFRTVEERVRRAYKSQSGRVRKAYQDFKRWSYGGRVRQPPKPSGTLLFPAIPDRTKNVVKPHDDETPAWPRSSFPITDTAPRRTFTVTETETVTKTEIETQTVTAFGLNFANHHHASAQSIGKVDPQYLGAGVVLACAAGCWWVLRKHSRRRARAAISEEVVDQATDQAEEPQNEESEPDNSESEVRGDDQHQDDAENQHDQESDAGKELDDVGGTESDEIGGDGMDVD